MSRVRGYSRGNSVPNKKYIPYKGLPAKLMKLVNGEIRRFKQYSMRGGVIVCNSCYPKATYDFVKRLSASLSEKNDMSIFVVIPNKDEGYLIPKVMLTTTPKALNLIRTTERGFDFFGEFIDRRKITVSCAEYDCYNYTAVVNGKFSIVYMKQKLSPEDFNKEYFYEGLEIPHYTSADKYGISEPMTMPTYIITKVKEVPKDFSKVKEIVMRLGSMQDLSLVWDFHEDEPVYTDDEVMLLVANLFYMEYSVPAFNMVLCGKPSSKKTPWLVAISKIFGDEVIESSQARGKGLVPHFWGEIPDNGALINSKFCSLLDDYFRMFSSNVDKVGIYKAIHDGLESVKGILDREERVVPSGKGNVLINYKSSFFATDNYSYPGVLKEIWEKDPAILKRYTFLILSQESEVKGNALLVIDQRRALDLLRQRLSKIFGMDGFVAYRILTDFMRSSFQKVVFDQKRVDLKVKEVKQGRDFYFEPKATALIKSVVVLNSLVKRHSTKFVAEECDYADFERLFKRLIDDFEVITRKGKPLWDS